MLSRRWFPVLAVLILAVMACGLFGGGGEAEGQMPSSEEESAPSGGADSGGSGDLKTEFPLPKKFSNLMEVETGEGGINFQTPMSIDEVVEFYRDEFGNKLGYSERDYLTTIAESNFQLVFDGHPGGVPIVIQGVDLGGSTNVNIRFEDA